MMFSYLHRTQFYETDQMGIVHHANYVRFCEEARVAWAHEAGLINYQEKDSPSQFAVIGADVRYLKPSFFGDQLEIQVQGRLDGPRIFFEYKIYCIHRAGKACRELVSEARTSHVSLKKDLKPQRPSKELVEVFANLSRHEKGKPAWIETWLSSL